MPVGDRVAEAVGPVVARFGHIGEMTVRPRRTQTPVLGNPPRFHPQAVAVDIAVGNAVTEHIPPHALILLRPVLPISRDRHIIDALDLHGHRDPRFAPVPVIHGDDEVVSPVPIRLWPIGELRRAPLRLDPGIAVRRRFLNPPAQHVSIRILRVQTQPEGRRIPVLAHPHRHLRPFPDYGNIVYFSRVFRIDLHPIIQRVDVVITAISVAVKSNHHFVIPLGQIDRKVLIGRFKQMIMIVVEIDIECPTRIGIVRTVKCGFSSQRQRVSISVRPGTESPDQLQRRQTGSIPLF